MELLIGALLVLLGVALMLAGAMVNHKKNRRAEKMRESERVSEGLEEHGYQLGYASVDVDRGVVVVKVPQGRFDFDFEETSTTVWLYVFGENGRRLAVDPEVFNSRIEELWAWQNQFIGAPTPTS